MYINRLIKFLLKWCYKLAIERNEETFEDWTNLGILLLGTVLHAYSLSCLERCRKIIFDQFCTSLGNIQYLSLKI